jgi:hypothetical protein
VTGRGPRVAPATAKPATPFAAKESPASAGTRHALVAKPLVTRRGVPLAKALVHNTGVRRADERYGLLGSEFASTQCSLELRSIHPW